MVLGGGNLVMPILIELERLGSNTISSLFFVDSCCFCTRNRNGEQKFDLWQHKIQSKGLIQRFKKKNYN